MDFLCMYLYMGMDSFVCVSLFVLYSMSVTVCEWLSIQLFTQQFTLLYISSHRFYAIDAFLYFYLCVCFNF